MRRNSNWGKILSILDGVRSFRSTISSLYCSVCRWRRNYACSRSICERVRNALVPCLVAQGRSLPTARSNGCCQKYRLRQQRASSRSLLPSDCEAKTVDHPVAGLNNRAKLRRDRRIACGRPVAYGSCAYRSAALLSGRLSVNGETQVMSAQRPRALSAPFPFVMDDSSQPDLILGDGLYILPRPSSDASERRQNAHTESRVAPVALCACRHACLPPFRRNNCRQSLLCHR